MLEYAFENNRVVSIPNNSLNLVLHLDWTKCSNLTELIIGDDCFMNVNQFVLDGLNSLQSINIGDNSFNTQKDVETSDHVGSYRSRCFSITNCKQLASIQIGRFSFTDYRGEFKLESVDSFYYSI